MPVSATEVRRGRDAEMEAVQLIGDVMLDLAWLSPHCLHAPELDRCERVVAVSMRRLRQLLPVIASASGEFLEACPAPVRIGGFGPHYAGPACVTAVVSAFIEAAEFALAPAGPRGPDPKWDGADWATLVAYAPSGPSGSSSSTLKRRSPSCGTRRER